MNMNRVSINPDLLRWACERSRLDTIELETRFPKLAEWEAGETLPTLKQLEKFARATHVPIGYLFLPAPIEEPLPIPDFRTLTGRAISRPSPNLLDMLYVCQERQSWYREFMQVHRLPGPTFVGSVTTKSAREDVAQAMRETLDFDLDARRDCPTWAEALRRFIAQADQAGILVMVSGVVQNNNRRHLDPDEFRGFALTDELAPLVFINGADTKAAQMFTLAHELAHIWLGASALSDASPVAVPSQHVESWCNQVAAELLVPLQILRAELKSGESLDQTLSRLARRFKVSSLVILRRLLDVGWLNRTAFSVAYADELRRLTHVTKGSGGNFYLTTAVRVSRRFARSLVESTLEGQTLYRDAFRMLGISKTKTFHELGRSLNFLI